MTPSATATTRPAKIIILRPGEKKKGDHALCSTGTLRAQALAAQFLGRNANPSLFLPQEEPAAFLVITPHTDETATPAAETWGLQPKGGNGKVKKSDLDSATEAAVKDVLTNYAGKTVVMVWEHKHIASEDTNDDRTSLRALLQLDHANPAPPKKWEGDNYNFFWIVTWPANQVTVEIRQQTFTDPYTKLPNNAWGAPALNKGADCE
jgi:hypothetical protein